MTKPGGARMRIERTVLRALMALPPAVQRVLAGRPIVRDGQTLAVDTQFLLRLQRVTREPGIETLSAAAGRAAVRRQAALVAGDQPIGSVRDLDVAGLPARLYVPTAATTGAPTAGPLLVFIHGGGWVYGDLDSHDAPCRVLAERSGVRVLSVTYRLAPEHPFPAAYDDCLAAYRWVVAHAAELGADPARLAVGGDSAGGCLAATTAIEAAREGLPLALQVLVYPGADHLAATHQGASGSRALFAEGFYLTRDFMDLVGRWYLAGSGVALDDPRVSPVYADLPDGLAPAYVVTAGFDPLRDEGEAYARTLADAGHRVEVRRFSDQVHGFLNVVGVGRTSRAAVAEIAEAVRAALT